VTTVEQWTGQEAKTLRAALRMTILDFAEYLGVSPRTVANWESKGQSVRPTPQYQAVLDTALSRASEEARSRFVAARTPRRPVEEADDTNRRQFLAAVAMSHSSGASSVVAPMAPPAATSWAWPVYQAVVDMTPPR